MDTWQHEGWWHAHRLLTSAWAPYVQVVEANEVAAWKLYLVQVRGVGLRQVQGFGASGSRRGGSRLEAIPGVPGAGSAHCQCSAIMEGCCMANHGLTLMQPWPTMGALHRPFMLRGPARVDCIGSHNVHSWSCLHTWPRQASP